MRSLKRIQDNSDFSERCPFFQIGLRRFRRDRKTIDAWLSRPRPPKSPAANCAGVRHESNRHELPGLTSADSSSCELPIRQTGRHPANSDLIRPNSSTKCQKHDPFPGCFFSSTCSVLLVCPGRVTPQPSGNSQPVKGISKRFADRTWLQPKFSQAS